MKLSHIQQYQNQQTINKNNRRHTNFNGVIDSSMRYLATNQAIGANAVDFTFMVTPRTASDMINRGPAAGLETGRREVMGTVIDSSIGLFGAGVGAALAVELNKKYGLNVNGIFSAPQTLNILAQNKSEQIKNNKEQLDYIRTTLHNLKAYNPSSINADKQGFVKISDKTIDEVAKYFDNSLAKKIDFNTWTMDKTPESRSVILNKITENTGAQARYVLNSADNKIKSETNLKTLLNDIYIVSDAFNKDKVKAAFNKQIKAGNNISDNSFVKELLKFKKTRSAIGFGIAGLIGLSVQPLNIYLTKLKTGTDGFVGVEGRSKDKSNGFKGLKLLSSAAFSSLILGTLNMTPLQFLKHPSKFMDKMSFTGKVPTVNQLKGVYGVTIISRIFAARDKDELREVLTKDTLGYVSWLVLGDLVNRLVADGINKKVLNYDGKYQNTKNPFKRTMHASLKTRDEILIDTLAKNGISTTKKDGQNIIAKNFKELLNDMDKLAPEVKKATRKNLRALNIAQVAGYLFSGLVLGLGIPNLNIYVTNTLDKKRKAKAAQLESKNEKQLASV